MANWEDGGVVIEIPIEWHLDDRSVGGMHSQAWRMLCKIWENDFIRDEVQENYVVRLYASLRIWSFYNPIILQSDQLFWECFDDYENMIILQSDQLFWECFYDYE